MSTRRAVSLRADSHMLVALGKVDVKGGGKGMREWEVGEGVQGEGNGEGVAGEGGGGVGTKQ